MAQKRRGTGSYATLTVLGLSYILNACGGPSDTEGVTQLTPFAPIQQFAEKGFPIGDVSSLFEAPQNSKAHLSPILNTDDLKFGSGLGLSGSSFQSRFRWKNLGQRELNSSEILKDQVLTHNGIPIEGTQLKAIYRNGEIDWVNGNAPSFEDEDSVGETTFALSTTTAAERAAQELNYHVWRFQSPEQRYIAGAHTLKAAYSFVVSAASDAPGRGPALPLRVIVDAQTGNVIEQVPIAFHVDGTARVYRENVVASESEGLVQVTLPGLIDTGQRLSHQLFSVFNCGAGDADDTKCTQVATGAGGDFTAVSYNSTSYDEVIAFYSVTRAIAWHEQMLTYAQIVDESRAGLSWGTLKTTLGLSASNHLKVYVRAKTQGATSEQALDNAQYLPSGISGTRTPAILIGTGWEEGQSRTQGPLMYLGRDADVFMHEFGHHIVYRNLTSVKGQSGAMHEGFADYFVYAITGNNKLAESITSSGRPLREGSVTGLVGAYLSKPAHKAGEFWSSVLWNIRVSLGTWKNGIAVFDKIAWDAIDLLKSDAQYYDAISAMSRSAESFAAKEGLNALQIKEKMFTEFYQRGFIDAPAGNGVLPAMSSTLLSGVTQNTPAATTEQKAKDDSWCGVVTNKSSQPSSFFLLVISFVVPFLFVGKRKKVTIPLHRLK